MSSILRLLGLAATPEERSAADTETVRKIARSLDALEPDRARFVAAFAYVLSRVARADLAVSEEETRRMESIVSEVGRLAPEQAALVVEMAKAQNRLFGATENFLVTREFERIATREDKLALLECLFAVSAADEHISTAEDNEVRRVANELKLEHADFIEARRRYREHLGALRPDSDKEPGRRS